MTTLQQHKTGVHSFQSHHSRENGTVQHCEIKKKKKPLYISKNANFKKDFKVNSQSKQLDRKCSKIREYIPIFHLLICVCAYVHTHANVHMYHDACVKVRGKLVGGHHEGPGDWTQDIKLSSKYLYLLTHLSGPQSIQPTHKRSTAFFSTMRCSVFKLPGWDVAQW